MNLETGELKLFASASIKSAVAWGLAVDRVGNVIAAVNQNSTVVVLDAQGQRVTDWVVPNAASVCVDREGVIWVRSQSHVLAFAFEC